MASNREATDVVDITSESYRYMLQKKLQSYNFIVLSGLPKTGKTYFMERYTSERPLTKWQRKPIMDMLYSGCEYDPKFNHYIQEMESRVLPKLCEKPHHQVMVEGYFRMRSNRRKALSYNEHCGPSCLLVFDGPTRKIEERGMSGYENILSAEWEDHIEHMRDTFDWPKFSEGWSDIIYVNTFGQDGINWFSTQSFKTK